LLIAQANVEGAKGVGMERERIGVSALKAVNILCEGDVYDLAYLLLKIDDAKDRGKNQKSRNTVLGVAAHYAMLANMDHDRVEAIFERYGLPLGATVEHDDEAV
jgi:hypothetical protein